MSAAPGRALLRAVESGVLSTMSTELPGYPFGSVTPFVTTHDGHVAFYVSGIAQHTANMAADPKACLTVLQPGDGGAHGAQALARCTLVGDAAPVSADRLDEVRARYETFFPASRGYAATHDFAYWWLRPVRVRYIGGFGRIAWIERDEWLLPLPEWRDEERAILAHMNGDHAAAVADIARHGAGLIATDAELIALDPEGCHLRAGGRIAWVPFGAHCNTTAAVRDAMIALARTAADRGPG
ncbi:MAG: DUF2470 domain-containing protein [Planctomycetes bacterium]|nr:DUF2470 domain-containing protein [Planctomycetota bacterium]